MICWNICHDCYLALKKKKLNGFVVDRQRKETSHYWTPQILCFYRNDLSLQEKKPQLSLISKVLPVPIELYRDILT